MIQILLVDDHPLLVEGTKLIIETEPDMKVHIETSSFQAFETVKANSFDVMLFDLQMPEWDGFELTKKVLEVDPKARILIYSGFEILPHLELFMESGAIGFISKTATKDQLIRSIRCALDRDIVMPFSLLKEIYYRSSLSSPNEKSKEMIQLNDKEMVILKELLKGKKIKKLHKLFISVNVR